MSSNGWPKVALGELLTRVKNEVLIDDLTTYTRLTIRLNGRGIVVRDSVIGAEVGTKRQFVARAGQLVLSKIDAQNGAFGILPAQADNAIITGNFWAFAHHPNRLDLGFLEYLTKTEGFVDFCRRASEGTTNRKYLQEPRFLLEEIPLPPLEEQRRIVARINRLVAKIDEARDLRRRSTDECDKLCRAILRDERFGPLTPTPMSELVIWRKPHVQVIASDTYEFAGVYCFGRGVFRGQRRSGTEFAYKQLTQIRAGEFIYPKLMAWEGALAVIPEECDGLFVSPEFPVFTINEDRVLPEVLDVYFRSPAVWPSLSGVSTGTNVRRKRLNPSDFLKYQFPLPTRKAQLAVRAVRSRMNELRPLQQQKAQLDALLPSILDRAFKGAL